jgi:hypothetical protein
VDTLARVALPLVAWVTAAICGGLSAWHVRRLRRLKAPSVSDLRTLFGALTTEAQRADLRDELHEQQWEAQRALAIATMLPRSMARVALSSCAALALLSLAGTAVSREGGGHGVKVLGGLLASVAGFVGLVACTTFGRQARELGAELREGWRRAARIADREWTPGRPSG